MFNGEPIKSLSAEIDRIKAGLADIGAKTMYGKTCAEIAKDIVNKGARK